MKVLVLLSSILFFFAGGFAVLTIRSDIQVIIAVLCFGFCALTLAAFLALETLESLEGLTAAGVKNGAEKLPAQSS